MSIQEMYTEIEEVEEKMNNALKRCQGWRPKGNRGGDSYTQALHNAGYYNHLTRYIELVDQINNYHN